MYLKKKEPSKDYLLILRNILSIFKMTETATVLKGLQYKLQYYNTILNIFQ